MGKVRGPVKKTDLPDLERGVLLSFLRRGGEELDKKSRNWSGERGGKRKDI